MNPLVQLKFERDMAMMEARLAYIAIERTRNRYIKALLVI